MASSARNMEPARPCSDSVCMAAASSRPDHAGAGMGHADVCRAAYIWLP
ncbi:hypothetical protein [Corallococcus sp. 4LFB]